MANYAGPPAPMSWADSMRLLDVGLKYGLIKLRKSSAKGKKTTLAQISERTDE